MTGSIDHSKTEHIQSRILGFAIDFFTPDLAFGTALRLFGGSLAPIQFLFSLHVSL
jgi:hypothetical protein